MDEAQNPPDIHTACHDPLLLLTGRMQGDIDKGSVAAQAGLTCLACHFIEHIPNQTGNGNSNREVTGSESKKKGTQPGTGR